MTACLQFYQPDSVDGHRAPTNQVQGALTGQLTSESSNQPAPELTEEVLEQSESGSQGQNASNPLAVASTDANVQSSNPAPESSDASSRRSLWQQAYDKLCTEEDFGSKRLHYERYVLAHANVSASGTLVEISSWSNKLTR
jgi:hypothetical protein